MIGLTELKKALQSRVAGADLTSEFGYALNPKNKNLTLTIRRKGIVGNMQTDASAFESWAIVLKYYLHDLIDTVTIDWECDIDIANKEEGYLHYNRFIYRLIKFVQTYDWAFAAKAIPSIPSTLLCNAPSPSAAELSDHSVGSEGWIECKYVDDNKKDYDYMNHQFPVGLFDNAVGKDNAFATGKKSAIDIWAIKDNDFYLFELKKPDNRPLGIISETMFYTNVIHDLLSHKIQYDATNTASKRAYKNNYRDFKTFYDAYASGSINNIHAILLADNLHTLITSDLLDFINQSPVWKYHRIAFSAQKVCI